jgi:hypothetical protein
MGLVNGSDKYWDIIKHVERIVEKKNNARSSSEREEWAEKGKDLADRLREKYGYDDPVVSYIIDKYYLDRD